MSLLGPSTLKSEFEDELFNNILPFWHRLKTPESFIPALDNDNQPLASPLGLIMVSRLLWTYSRAFRLYGQPDHLALAEHARRVLIDRFQDRQHGGFFWSVDAETSDPVDDRKQCYGQAFCIYAFSEHYMATESEESIAMARGLYDLLESRAWDSFRGGYLETFQADWRPVENMRLGEGDVEAPKTMNNHLHMIEAYANLLLARRDPQVKDACRRLLRTIADRILLPGTPRFGLFYNLEWQLIDPVVSPGHDIEGSWLLHEAAEIVGDADLEGEFKKRSLDMAELVLATGLDAEGAVYDEFHHDQPRRDTRCWWPQAEAVVGFCNAYQLSGEPRYFEAAVRAWSFIKAKIVDRARGDWIWGIHADGTPMDKEKAGPWKSAYHSGRACMEMIARLDPIIRAERRSQR